MENKNGSIFLAARGSLHTFFHTNKTKISYVFPTYEAAWYAL